MPEFKKFFVFVYTLCNNNFSFCFYPTQFLMNMFRGFVRRVSSTSWSTYAFIWSLVTFNGCGMTVIMYYVAQQKLMSADHYKKALALLDEHADAKQMLGEPVRVGKINMFDKRRNHIRKTESRFHIPVCGTHLSGFVDVFANRKELKDAFTMQRLELELDDGERFLMFDRLAAAEQDEAAEKAKQTPTKRPRGR